VSEDSLRALSSATSDSDGRLDSWKEIALYLKRDVTTVRRWEKWEGLPIHRHLHRRRDSVSEIDHWWDNRGSRLTRATPEAATAPGSRLLVPSMVVAIAGLAATAALTTVLLTRSDGIVHEDAIERRFLIPPPSGMSFGDIAVSPDGRRIAFTATSIHDLEGEPTLWMQSLDSPLKVRLLDTEGASLPFWAPTSDALGFFAGGGLWTMDLAGTLRKIAVATNGRGATWSTDGTIVFAAAPFDRLFRVAASGGVVTAVTTLAAGEAGHVWPEFLPDGKHFLYLAFGPGGRGTKQEGFIAALDGSVKRKILTADSGVQATRDGYLTYVRGRRLMRQPFDLRRFTFTGEPIPLTAAEEVLEHLAYPSKSVFSISSRDVVIYRTSQSPTSRLTWRDRSGRQSALLDTPAEYFDPSLAPDDSRLAFDVFGRSHRFGYFPGNFAKESSEGFVSDLHVRDSTGRSSLLTSDPAADWGAVWSPDGTSVVFSSNRLNGALQLFQRTLSDPTSERPLTTTGENPVATSWSPDGRHVLYGVFDRKTKGDLWLLSLDGDRRAIPLLRTESNEEQGQISPNGRWVAYTSDASGRNEVWVTTFPHPADRWRISSSGAGDPRWRRDGKELFYIRSDRQLMAVPVNGTQRNFSHAEAVALFDTALPPHWYEARNLYDVTRDGRFVFMVPIEDDRSSPATIILNWQPQLTKQDASSTSSMRDP
jgi:Tol biopolymer transport system component